MAKKSIDRVLGWSPGNKLSRGEPDSSWSAGKETLQGNPGQQGVFAPGSQEERRKSIAYFVIVGSLPCRRLFPGPAEGCSSGITCCVCVFVKYTNASYFKQGCCLVLFWFLLATHSLHCCITFGPIYKQVTWRRHRILGMGSGMCYLWYVVHFTMIWLIVSPGPSRHNVGHTEDKSNTQSLWVAHQNLYHKYFSSLAESYMHMRFTIVTYEVK